MIEQRYMLDLARMVTVRTDPSRSVNGEGEEQRFGEVISERLIGLGNKNSTWRSWRDEDSGWFIGLSFDSRDGEHDAIWSLDHRKRVLTPISPDATNLSKVGEIGDRLIPKLRAVESENGERFDSDAFDPDALLAETSEHDALPHAETVFDDDSALFGLGNLRSSSAPTEADTDAEYQRRREIDSLAVSTPVDHAEDLNQTSDLLDALRRRRGEREQGFDVGVDLRDKLHDSGPSAAGEESPVDDAEVSEDTEQVPPRTTSQTQSQAARNIWGASGVSGSAESSPNRLRAVDPISQAPVDTQQESQGSDSDASESGPEESSPTMPEPGAASKPQPEAKTQKRGRSSIPSWDDILFGTRSDDDPA